MDLTYNFTNNLLSRPYLQHDIYYNGLSSLAKNWETVAHNPYLFNNEISFDFIYCFTNPCKCMFWKNSVLT